MKLHTIRILCFVLIALHPVAIAQAAVLGFESEKDIVQVGDVLRLAVVLDTQGVQVNAIEAELLYPKEVLDVSRIIDGDSVINFWVETPALREPGKLFFSGITPGGVQGREINIITIEFTVKKEGVASLTLDGMQVLQHDGLGTALQTTSIPFSINILGQSSVSAVKTQYVDTEAPEAFTPLITSDADVFDGRKFLVFSTEDKGSGIDYYEVKEGEFGSYARATSPYEIKDQTQQKKFSVRAVDKEGNEYVATLYPQNQIPWQQTPLAKAVILVVCLITVLFLSRRYFKKSVSS